MASKTEDKKTVKKQAKKTTAKKVEKKEKMVKNEAKKKSEVKIEKKVSMKKMHLKPLVTEKAVMLIEAQNVLMFETQIKSKRDEIKKEVEAIFEVKVNNVRTLIRNGKKFAYDIMITVETYLMKAGEGFAAIYGVVLDGSPSQEVSEARGRTPQEVLSLIKGKISGENNGEVTFNVRSYPIPDSMMDSPKYGGWKAIGKVRLEELTKEGNKGGYRIVLA